MPRKKTSAKKAVTKKKAAAKKKTPTKKRPGKAKAGAKKVQRKTVGSCFVMMPFKPPFDVYYHSIFKPAIIAAGLDPVRADDLFRPSVIVSDLWQMIQDADVLLAELTTKNANVFYELGLSHAIGKPVILVSETMDDVPFDLQQLRVLLYDKNDPTWGDKLTACITEALRETLKTPVEAVPNIFRTKVRSHGPEQNETEARIETLERQMRLLLRHSNLPPESLVPAAERELTVVTEPGQLIQWVQRWLNRGMNSLTLKAMIRHNSQIPGGWVRLVKEVNEKLKSAREGDMLLLPP